MKNFATVLYIFLFIIASQTFLIGQEKVYQTEIIVIGTVHNPTSKFDEEKIVRILENAKPDLIFLEFDSSFFDESLKLAQKYQGISLESRAVTNFQKSADVKVRPFDIEGRNRFYQENDYFNREIKLNREVGNLYGNNSLSPEARVLWESLLSFASVRDACGAESPEIINSTVCDAAVEKKQFYGFKGLKRIIELTPALAEFKSFWDLADDFWERRNGEMIKNIVSQSKTLQAQRAVILCGFEHRYYLKKHLDELSKKEGFVVREYWDSEIKSPPK